MINNLNSLFIKRVYVTTIDVIFFLILLVYDTKIIFNLPMELILILDFLCVYLIYYCAIPIFNKGQTIGGMIFGLKIVFLEEYSIFEKIKILLLRTIYAIFTFYPYRLLHTPKMNNIGQLYFDEKFNISIISKAEDIKSVKKTNYEYVALPTSFFFKIIFSMFIVMLIVDILANYLL
jgi:hypothetical protein